MEFEKTIDFFLGANTQDGFCSRFEELRNVPNYRYQYIIKGSPGCGKSTFMRRIADAADVRGHRVERIGCSSDPDSLDAVLISDLGISVVDGTSPHVAEPRYAGAAEQYIDFTPFWDVSALMENRDDIAAVDGRIKDCYRHAYGHLRCAGVYDGLLHGYAKGIDRAALDRRIKGLLKRELPRGRSGADKGRTYIRYLSGFTPKGHVSCYFTLQRMCDRVVAFTDDFGVARDVLSQTAETAQAAGHDVYVCLSPLYREAVMEAVIVPALRLGFVAMDKHNTDFVPSKQVHLTPYVRNTMSSQEYGEAKRLLRLRQDAIDAGLHYLSAAKANHDDLEQLYRPHMDFAGIGVFTEQWLLRLGLK